MTSNAEKRCKIAADVAFDTIMEECGIPYEEGFFLERFSRIMGVENNPGCENALDEGLTEEVCNSFSKIRRFTMCEAWRLMREEAYAFSDAMELAWDKIKQGCPNQE